MFMDLRSHIEAAFKACLIVMLLMLVLFMCS